MTAKAPNILIVMADQMAPAFLPIYGHGLVRAPNMLSLARDGIVFDSAYCASPLCAPSRASFMSGLLPSRTCVYDNAAEFAAGIPTFAHGLRARGYRTILSGKMHFCGPDQLHGFEERLTTDIYPADFNWTPDWDRPEHRPSWYHNMGSVRDAGTCVRSNQLDFDDEAAFMAERAIFDHARSKDRRPFLLAASFSHPHDPFAIPRQYWDLYRDEDIDMPAPGAALDPHSRRLRHVCAMDAEPVTEAQVRAARRAYYGAIAYVDDLVGRLMGALRSAGLAEDTIVILTSDHGEMLGERGLWYKMSFFEGSSRVPLVIANPGRFGPRRVAASVSLIDLMPTLVELAGGTVQSLGVPTDGRSLAPHLRGAGGHDEAIGEYLAEGAIAPIAMIRRGAFKFIHSPADPDQLYDLARDPGERANLADDPASAALIADFRAEVAKRWDLAELDARVRLSQRRRRLVDAGLSKGKIHAWDFQPVRDAAKQYVRNSMDLDDIEAMARFPPVARR
ncbi:MAG TPA: choline-sulfatase [Roseiarcus sp.]|jgi:choline-sulfatase|nr:choline-sulfatase [Roseiarcus sp.]